jgi:phosphoribosyl 1,2-cyclic phosphate phosphodiesterase
MKGEVFLQITFLGTGTSHGIPVIACDCSTCRSNNPKNKRNRTSIYVETAGYHILIDTPPEMRLELLKNNIKEVDLILMTHAHADHLMGFDDIRALNWYQGKEMPVYANSDTISHIKRVFPYIFAKNNPGGGVPQVILRESKSKIKLANLTIMPIPIYHGNNLILGYRIGKFAYLTDCSKIPAASYPLLDGVEYAAVDALRYREHPTHMNVEQAVNLIKKLQLKHGYLTHLSHRLEHERLSNSLPDNISVAYDNLVINI